MAFKITPPVRSYQKHTLEGDALEVAYEIRARMAEQGYVRCTSGNGCVMRHKVSQGTPLEKTLKCALGQILPEDCFKPGTTELVDGLTNGSLPENFFNCTKNQAAVIRALQSAHDNAKSPEEMAARFESVIRTLEACEIR